MGVDRKVGAFGEELAGEAVPVLVGAALPRRVRIAEVDIDVGRDGELGVLSELTALVPGQRFGEFVGQTRQLCCETLSDVSRGAVIDSDELAVSGGAFHNARHRGLAGFPDDQVAFPVAGDGTILNLCGPLRDVDHVSDFALPGIDPALPLPPAPVAAQTPGELFTQLPVGLDVDRVVDRFVRHPPGWIIRVVSAKSLRDLLGRPTLP